MRLYDDQEYLRESISAEFAAGHKRVLAVAPTGFGKTVTFADIARRAISRGHLTYILVHRDELVDQVASTLERFGVHHGFITASRDPDSAAPVQVCSVQTLARRLDRVKAPSLIIIDEAHHCVSATQHGKVLKRWPDAFALGVTATPQRLSGEGLGEIFSSMVLGPTLRELIYARRLSDYVLYAPPIDQIDVPRRGGDYARGALATAVNKPKLIGDAIQHYRRIADGKRAIIRAVTIEHSRHIAAQFNAAGIPCEHVDGETPRDQRKAAITRFRNGRLMALSNVDLFSEGFDVPAVEVAIDLRPTESLTLWLQFCGRALRVAEGKQRAIIIDHAGNALRHGAPCAEREWSLDGRKRTKSETHSTASVKTCVLCFAALQFCNTNICTYCGAEQPRKERKIDAVDGTLIEMSAEEINERREQLTRRREQGKARTLEELTALGKSRGFRNPSAWARHVFNGRRAK